FFSTPAKQKSYSPSKKLYQFSGMPHQSAQCRHFLDCAKGLPPGLVHGFDGHPNQPRRTAMSHHLDSPIARQDIRLDITDLYVFRGETGTVFVINLCHSIFGPIPVPGYHPEGMYEFKVDLNGDAIEDLTYRFTFNERDNNARQTYTLRRLIGADAANPEAAGTVLGHGTTGEVLSTAPGLRVWAGKAG